MTRLTSLTGVQLSGVDCTYNLTLRIVYEKIQPEPNNPLPHLWRYRTIVSLEHFSQSFSTADVKTKDKCPLVDKFLREENKLFVTRYLPDIVQLQRRMRDKFLHRLDRKEVSETNIKSFLDKIKKGNIYIYIYIPADIFIQYTVYTVKPPRSGHLPRPDMIFYEILTNIIYTSVGENIQHNKKQHKKLTIKAGIILVHMSAQYPDLRE